MSYNDILRRLRYTFNYSDLKLIELFNYTLYPITIEEINQLHKKEDDPEFRAMQAVELSMFLNGMIIDKRGKKDDEIPFAEKTLTNNIILRKLKIALNLKDEDMIEIFKLADMRVSKPELTSFFRKVDHKHYRECKNQFLRNFLMGLQLKYRPK